MGNYFKAKEIILSLNANELLNGKIFLVGGTVPYIVAGTASDREHSDIDMVADSRDMGMVRTYLRDMGLYDAALDSLELPYNKEKADYGIDAVIHGITVNFAPFEVEGQNLIQRNFLTKKNNGLDALVMVRMENIQLAECMTAYSIDQTVIQGYKLEMVKLMKEKSNKPKDKIDIKIIDNFGYDSDTYERLKEKTKNMKFKVIPKNKLLRIVFR